MVTSETAWLLTELGLTRALWDLNDEKTLDRAAVELGELATGGVAFAAVAIGCEKTRCITVAVGLGKPFTNDFVGVIGC